MNFFIFFSLFFSLSVFAKIRVAITVDDLPSHSPIPANTTRLKVAQKMLNSLKKHQVPEVYGFINAGKVADEPALNDVLKLWVKSGYPLANHTYNHPSINSISIDEFKKEIDLNEKPLSELNGKMDWKYFRYPFLREGNTLEKRNAIRAYLKEKNYKIAQVTIDFEDWLWNVAYARCFDKKDQIQIQCLKESYIKNAVDQLKRAEVLSQALFKRSIAHVLLLHVGAFDAEMMDALLKAYKNEGVEFIPLSEAQRDEVYELDPAVVREWGSELTYQVLRSRGLKLTDVGLEPYKDFPEDQLNSTCK